MKGLSFMRIFAVMVKEFTQLRRDRITYGMILVMPLVQLLLFGFAINTDPHHLPAAVISYDHGRLANAVVASMERTNYVDVKYLPQSEAEMDRLMRRGDIALALTIPADFSERVIKGDNAQILAEVDASDPQAAAGAAAAVAALPSQALHNDLPGVLTQNAPRGGALPTAMPGAPFQVVLHNLYNPEAITSYNIVPGLLAIILSMTLIMMTAMAVTREVERGTMETLLSTPVTALEVMIGKLAPYVLVGLTQTVLVLILARVLFHVPMPLSFAGWLSLGVGIVLYIINNLSLGYLISTVARSQLQAMQLSVFYMLPSMLLSGFMFPFSGLPKWAQIIGEVIPVTHFLRIVRGALLKDQTLSDMGPNLAALSAFLVIVTALTLARSRKTLD
jgi:ABC-2 type transport system permease protein